MSDAEDRWKLLEDEIERRLVERFAALRDEFDRLRLEADRRWAGFLDRFEQKLTGIVPTEMLPEPESKAIPELAKGTLPVEAVRSLDQAANQVEALQRFLDLCRRYASRAALLVTRGGSVGVWKAVGFTEYGGDDEDVRRVALPSEPGGTLARVLEGHPCELVGDNDVSGALSARDAEQAVLIPMVVREKISGALYADCVVSEKGRFDPEALGFLTFLAGLIVDRLASRKLTPAPSLAALEAAVAPAPAAPSQPEFELAEDSFTSAPERAANGSAQMITPEVSTAPPPPPPEEPPRPTVTPFARQLEQEERAAPRPERPLGFAPEPTPPPGRTIRIPTSVIGSPAPAPPEAPAAPRRPSAGVRRLSGPLAPAEGDERREEARRFAKLLVSEIKLYNEKAVQQGRAQGNIYELLKEDIDRSRQMYDERIPEDVRANSNFFYEELVRVLAEGRSEALGL